jgi:hypothetical protein
MPNTVPPVIKMLILTTILPGLGRALQPVHVIVYKVDSAEIAIGAVPAERRCQVNPRFLRPPQFVICSGRYHLKRGFINLFRDSQRCAY